MLDEKKRGKKRAISRSFSNVLLCRVLGIVFQNGSDNSGSISYHSVSAAEDSAELCIDGPTVTFSFKLSIHILRIDRSFSINQLHLRPSC